MGLTTHDATMAHLRTDHVSVVLDARGPGLPSIIHWGAALGELTDADVEALVAHLEPALAHNAADVRVPLAIVPEAGTGHPGRPGLRGHRAGRNWSPSFALTGTRLAGERTVELTAFDQRNQLELTSMFELTPSGLLRLRHQLRNIGAEPYVVDGLAGVLPLPSQATELLDFTGHWCRERHPQRHPLGVGAWVRENRRGRTGHDATLGLLAGRPGFGFRHGEVWALHVAWSGNHVTWAERLPEGHAMLGGGELLTSGEVILEQHRQYTSPWIYAAYSACGLDGISAAFHGWLRSRPHHPGPHRPRPVIANTWEAVYFDHDLGRLKQLADVAAQVGVERYVLDDGWFRGRRDDTAGLGDWFVDETVWPEGLGPIIDHVRSLGMDFGLWVEPEMVNPDSELHRTHQEWVLGGGGGTLPPLARHQQVLDLVNPGAYAYVLARLDALLARYDIASLKWDHNRDLVDAGHDGHPAVHAQTRAVYRLLDELRSRHPGVEIESCSSGGGRVDLEILERTDRVWASDCNDALERQTIQRWTGLFLPPELIGAHVGPPRAHTTGRTHDLSFRVATAVFGHFGVEWDIASASPEDRAALARSIAFYKQVRGLVHTGTVVHADHPDPAAWVHGVVAADRSRALFCVAQLATSQRSIPSRVRLVGLDDERRYRVQVSEPAGPVATMQRAHPPWTTSDHDVLSGRILSQIGIQPPILAPEQAWLITVEAVDADR
jgi:alpha-galactosidase